MTVSEVKDWSGTLTPFRAKCIVDHSQKLRSSGGVASGGSKRKCL